MIGNYPVLFGANQIGKVQILKQGLYYRFICLCRHDAHGVYRLMADLGNSRVPIGVLVPEKDGFGLNKTLPVKRFEEGQPNFYLVPMHDSVKGKFVPISPEEPFLYLSRLKDAFLIYQNGKVGAMIPDDR